MDPDPDGYSVQNAGSGSGSETRAYNDIIRYIFNNVIYFYPFLEVLLRVALVLQSLGQCVEGFVFLTQPAQLALIGV